MFDFEEDSNRWFALITALLLVVIALHWKVPKVELSLRDNLDAGNQAQRLLQQGTDGHSPLLIDLAAPQVPDAPEPAPAQGGN